MKTISLTQGKVAFVDDADYEAVSAHKWYAHKHGRRWVAARNIRNPDGKRVTQLLHRFLMPGVAEIDHRDGNSLNNQRENLRPATRLQNSQGFRHKKIGATARFMGISWNKRMGKWHAQIQVDGEKIHLGFFDSETGAAKARDAAALKYFGEHAHLNFPKI